MEDEKPVLANQGRDGNRKKGKTVTLRSPSPLSSPSPSSSSSSSSSTSIPPKWVSFITARLEWIKPNLKFAKWKPVLRCALAAWISAVIFVIPAVEIQLGQASFLILIVAFLSPPSDPFMAALEREMLILFFVCLAWAWSSLGIFLADLTRKVRNPSATFLEAITGEFVEAAPSIIMAIFIFIGTAFFLFIRVTQGPGPYLFACVLGCICLDITLTTAALFPYPFYLIGRTVVIPLALHTAIAILASIFVFPSTVSAQYTTRIIAVLDPVTKMLETNERLLATGPDDNTPESSQENLPPYPELLSSARLLTRTAESLLVPLAAAARLLHSDLIYARFAPADFDSFQGLCRRLVGRSDGLGIFYSLVEVGVGSVTGEASAVPSLAGTVPTTPRNGRRDGTASTPGSPPQVGTPRGAMTPTTAPLAPSHASSPLSHMFKDAHTQLHFSQSVTAGLQSHTSSHRASGNTSGTATPIQTSGSLPHHMLHHHHSQPAHHHALHASLSALARSLSHQAPHVKRRAEWAVGTFESQRYLNLEQTRLYDPREAEWTKVSFGLLQESCLTFLPLCQLGLSTTQTWLTTVRSGRLKYLFNIKQEEAREQQHERKKVIESVRDKVKEGLKAFRDVDRHLVLEPYRKALEHNPDSVPPSAPVSPHAFQPASKPLPNATNELESTPMIDAIIEEPVSQKTRISAAKVRIEEEEAPRRPESNEFGANNKAEQLPTDKDYEMPPHRYLFNCYVYQYNLIQIGSIVVEMLDEILRLEEERLAPRLWTPVAHAFRWNPWLIPEGAEQMSDDDNPDVIQGLHCDELDQATESSTTLQGGISRFDSHHTTGPAFGDPEADLGLPRKRDPDALPPRNFVEWFFGAIHKLIVGLGGGNSVYAFKAGVLTVLLCLPSFIKSSAEFAYENRFVWAIFMGQLSLARFRGDTTFSLVARVSATFFGGVTGMVMWYISCGSGQGNAFGFAAVCLVCFPFFFFISLYCPVPPMMNIVFFVTSVLVVGYSYQDVHLINPAAPGVGISVFWKRVLLVTAGVVAAFIASFLPPSTTIRRYQRRLLATTSAEMGTIYCAILSFANTKHEHEIQDIISSLIAVRSKLSRSNGLRANVGYEFSLRGRWPSERYQKIADLQMALAYSLSHLMSVLEHLESSWSRAFLRRTRFMDPDFQGDILAVISMISSSLRTGCPLPQITPCPLLDRFTLKYHGLDVIHKDSEEDYGLPRTLSIETLRNEQYLMFCVGISIAYGVINRLDQLMLAVKEVVGEQYHIHGVGLIPYENSHPLSDSGSSCGIRFGDLADRINSETLDAPPA